MKSLTLPLVLICLMTVTLSAQLKIGIGGGVLTSSLYDSDNSSAKKNESASLSSRESARSFQFTLPVQYQFNTYFSLQAEVSYQRMIFQTRYLSTVPTQSISLSDYTETYSINYFYTSALARLSTGGKKFALFLIGGPSLGRRGSGSRLITEYIYYSDRTPYEQQRGKSLKASELPFESTDYGIIYGGGISLGLPHYDISLDARKYRSMIQVSQENALSIATWSLNTSVFFTLK